MVTPLLLLSPSGSRDRAGVVTPTVVGAVSVVAGQYGQAWSCSGTDTYVTVPTTGHITPNAGTIVARGKLLPGGSSSVAMSLVLQERVLNRWRVGFSPGRLNARVYAAGAFLTGPSIIDGQFVTLAMAYGGNVAQLYQDGVADVSTAYTPAAFADTAIYFGGYVGVTYNVQVESVLIYDVPLTPSQIAVLSQPKAWTWDMLDDGPIPGLLLPV